MKYKVLKDYVDENGQMTRVGDTRDSSFKTKFENVLLENGFIEKIKVGFEHGDKYYYVDDAGDVAYGVFYENPFDIFRQNQGNAFRTWEEAEKYLEYLEAKAVLRAEAIPWDKTDGDKWYVYYSVEDFTTLIISCADAISYNGQFYFASREDAEASIKNHGKEWRIVFDYEREHGA